MNYLVIGNCRYSIFVANYLTNITEKEPLLVQFNGTVSAFTTKNYATSRTIIDPISLAICITTLKGRVGKIHINSYAYVRTPYDITLDRINKTLFPGSIKEVLELPKNVLEAAKYEYKLNDSTQDELFIKSVEEIKPYIEVVDTLDENIYLDNNYSNIYLSQVPLKNDAIYGTDPVLFTTNIEYLPKEPFEVYLVIDVKKSMPTNLDFINRLIDRHHLDLYDNFKYHLVICNADNINQVQILGHVWHVSKKAFMLAIDNLYINIEDVLVFKNNKLELWNPLKT